MKLSEVIEILEKNIPKAGAWTPCRNEPFGSYGIKNFEAEVQRVLFCVTPTDEVVDFFNKHKYDLLIAHHPFIQPHTPMLIYHTALDCADPHGINSMWRDALGIKNAAHITDNLGWYGSIDPITFEDLLPKIENFIGDKPNGFLGSSGEVINSVAVCSGLGGAVFREAQ